MKNNILLLLLILTTGLGACSKADDDADSIFGTWEAVSEYLRETVDGEIVETTRQLTAETDKYTYTFNKDLTCVIRLYNPNTDKWINTHLTYEDVGDKITILTKKQGAARDLEFRYVLNGNELVLTERIDADEMKTTFRRK